MNKQKRVLVVDDLPKWREELVEILQRAGFYADSGSTVAEGLQRLEKRSYHVLILDIRLVDTDANNEEGLDLLRELHKRGLGQAMKVIILSTQERESMCLDSQGYKVADFLSKDEFKKQVFLESVQRVLSEDKVLYE